ncbi:MAG: bifunctional 4-hydroxy-2-oxoglutarate aldolase/2-dehydro-3-deoxy-phosphogluconate aldolase [Solirubrobacteraceae bacterium]
MTASVLERLAAQRAVPVLRSATVRDALDTARACARAGMSVVELTHSTPDVEDAVRALGAEGLVVGVGTITDAAQVRAAVDAGARFVVSYTMPEGMVQTAAQLGIPAIPGALTPTEVAACLRAGAAAVKVFPVRALSPDYLRDLRAVMPQLRAIVTGGLAADPDLIRPWLQAGALAVGLGSDIGTVAAVGVQEVERRARLALGAAAG